MERAAKLLRLARAFRGSIDDIARVDLPLEYPVAGLWTDGQLASRYIDLLAVEDDRVDIIDFKTDTPHPVRWNKSILNMPTKSGSTESCLKPLAS